MKRATVVIIVAVCFAFIATSVVADKLEKVGGVSTPPLQPSIPWVQEVAVDKFDPSLGKLLSVRVWASAEIYGWADVEENSAPLLFGSPDVVVNAAIQVAAPPGAGSDLRIVVGGQGLEGGTSPILQSPVGNSNMVKKLAFSEYRQTSDVVINAADLLANYVASGPKDQLLRLPTTSIALSSFIRDADNMYFVTTLTNTQLHVEYEYQPKMLLPIIPEAGTVSLACLGLLAGVPVFRRKFIR
ncbi:MAG: hypothetical protein ACUVRS_11190 [Armatimonadota bacterium]